MAITWKVLKVTKQYTEQEMQYGRPYVHLYIHKNMTVNSCYRLKRNRGTFYKNYIFSY